MNDDIFDPWPTTDSLAEYRTVIAAIGAYKTPDAGNALPPRQLRKSPDDEFNITFIVTVKRGDKKGGVVDLNNRLVREALSTLANAYFEGGETIEGLDSHPSILDTRVFPAGRTS
jgi:hypothetical protein